MPEIQIPLIFNVFYTVPSCEVSIFGANIVLITFSEMVVDFSEDDVDITGATVIDFTGNGRAFYVEVQIDTTAEIFVPAGACESLNGVLNTASNRLIYEG